MERPPRWVHVGQVRAGANRSIGKTDPHRVPTIGDCGPDGNTAMVPRPVVRSTWRQGRPVNTDGVPAVGNQPARKLVSSMVLFLEPPPHRPIRSSYASATYSQVHGQLRWYPKLGIWRNFETRPGQVCRIGRVKRNLSMLLGSKTRPARVIARGKVRVPNHNDLLIMVHLLNTVRALAALAVLAPTLGCICGLEPSGRPRNK